MWLYLDSRNDVKKCSGQHFKQTPPIDNVLLFDTSSSQIILKLKNLEFSFHQGICATRILLHIDFDNSQHLYLMLEELNARHYRMGKLPLSLKLKLLTNRPKNVSHALIDSPTQLQDVYLISDSFILVPSKARTVYTLLQLLIVYVYMQKVFSCLWTMIIFWRILHCRRSTMPVLVACGQSLLVTEVSSKCS